MAHVIVGTAGHIDHGKSALVRALTGTDPDRLPEEQRRRITIDLGYAFLDDVAAIIDVPGHEKFIRNMVAGAATIDFAMLVIAADDGVMPQTTEHLQILRLLGVEAGCVVITKIATVEQEWLELVKDQVGEAVSGTFLVDAPIFEVDSLAGTGIPELRAYLLETLTGLKRRPDRGLFREPIDRVFSIKGHGTVVTGTILAGSVARQDKLAVLPGDASARVKNIETHGHDLDHIGVGQRAALNLIGDVEDIERGNTLTLPDALPVTTRLRAVISLLPGLPPLRDRQRIRFLIGTDEAIGRVQILDASPERTYVNVLLEKPVVAAWGDHFVLRRYSPMETLGGGRVLEPVAPRLRARDLPPEIEFCTALDTAAMESAITAAIAHRGRLGVSIAGLARWFAVTRERILEIIKDSDDGMPCEIRSDFVMPRAAWEEHADLILARLSEFHNRQPDLSGISPAELKPGPLRALNDALYAALIQDMTREKRLAQSGGLLSLPDARITLNPELQDLVDLVSSTLSKAGFTPPSAAVLSEQLGRTKPEIEKALVIAERLGRARRLGVDLFFDIEQFENAVDRVCSSLNDGSRLTVADVSKLLASSRKYVVPFLEFLDADGRSKRQGDVRVAGDRLRANIP